ncbi:uncharacterized protein LOC128894609 [Hylaeus anthracinus]|uniref:uncharacterized protein LOC128894609 n=1 Tax=Hylaeus anthracinus TaxID=313031 RepID=UPI0023B92336|nr:uncharacterized protein LOC128894609 [Hylaeus anthracinus]
MTSAVWTLLLILCLVASFDVDAATKSPKNLSDSRESSSESEKAGLPSRLPRRFRQNSRTRRVHIENQTGFDGKVEKIHINSEEDLPGVRAYGMPKKSLMSNDDIDRMLGKEVEGKLEVGSRPLRAIEAYGKSKERLENNGEIERVQSPVSMGHQVPRDAGARVSRSIEEEPNEKIKGDSKGDPEDLEAQDAKVFRPLFVYRQQVARRQHRLNNQPYGYRANQIPRYGRPTVY